MKTFHAKTTAQWRAWLAKHHDSESEVWLVFHKKHTGQPAVDYEDAVKEALCFGWIDSLIKRIDHARYARKFTPRKPDSRWSSSNRKRYAQLQASGRLMPVGRKLAPAERSAVPPPRWAGGMPRYIQQALKDNAAAGSYFESLAPSYRRHYVGWIDSAKRQETKERRLREAIGLLAARKKLGLK